MSPIAMMAATSVSAAARMTLAIHQNTSSGAGYRRSLEGWARAGIKNVEITTGLLDEFLKTESLAAAKRVLTDLGLTPVSAPAVSRASGSRTRIARRALDGSEAAIARCSPTWA